MVENKKRSKKNNKKINMTNFVYTKEWGLRPFSSISL